MSFLMDAIISSSQTATFSVIVLSSFPPTTKFPFYCLADIISQSSQPDISVYFLRASVQASVRCCVSAIMPLCPSG